MKGMPIKLKVYITIVTMLGFASVYFGLRALTRENFSTMIFFAILVIVSESVAIQLNNKISISVSFGIGLASVLIFQSPAVAIIGFLPMIFSVQSVEGKVMHIFNTSFIKRVFNGCAFALSLVMANFAYVLSSRYFDGLQFNSFNIPGIVMLILVFSIFDASIYIGLVSLIENNSFIKMINEETWLIFIVDLIAIAPLGIIIAIIHSKYGMFAVALFFGPLLLARFSYKLYIDMKKMYSETILTLSNAIDAKDQYTSGHSHRVAEYAIEISKRMGFNQSRIDKIRTVAILHDIGKIGIDDNILNKPGKLEEIEFVEIKKHPEIGANILAQVTNLSEVAKIIKHHHERYDGTGYPEGIGKDMVPIESYIISVSDAYDAMTTDRPYRRAIDNNVAIQIIISESGKQFNPIVVKAFLQYMDYKEEQLIYAV